MADVVTSNLFYAITGKTAKANILIIDRRTTDSAGNRVVKKKGSVEPGSISKMRMGGPAASGMKKMANKAAGAASSAAEKATSKVKESVPGSGLAGDYNKMFTVQFNPSSLRVGGQSGGINQKMDFGRKGGISTGGLSAFITLSVNLIFDQMELANAFPVDTMDTSLTSAMTKIIKGVTAAYNDLPISVQAVTEGFIGALRNPYTREVCFSWGQLQYKGVLKGVSSNYKMFDLMGRPVRSEVRLEIYLRDQSIEPVGGKLNLGFWQDAYNNAFSESSTYVGTGTKIARKILGM